MPDGPDGSSTSPGEAASAYAKQLAEALAAPFSQIAATMVAPLADAGKAVADSWQQVGDVLGTQLQTVMNAQWAAIATKYQAALQTAVSSADITDALSKFQDLVSQQQQQGIPGMQDALDKVAEQAKKSQDALLKQIDDLQQKLKDQLNNK